MNWFYNLKTARKLALGFGLCLTLAVLVGIVAITRMAQMNRISADIVSNSLERRRGACDDSRHSARQFRIVEYRHAAELSRPPKRTRPETDLTTGAGRRRQSAQRLSGARMTDPADTQNFNELQAEWQKYVAMKDALLVVSRNNDTKQGAATPERADEGRSFFG